VDQREIESVGLFLLLSVKKGTLLKVLKNELGGGKQRNISAKFELRRRQTKIDNGYEEGLE